MKKILIFYASFGGGHLSAAKSIETYLKENYQDFDVELIDCMKYANKPLEKVSTAAYRGMAKNAPWAWGFLYNNSQKGPLAHISSKANAFMAIKLLQLLKEKQPDIIISTHPFGSQMCSYLKRKGKIDVKIATILTDFRSHDQWLVGSDYGDLFFVSNETMKQELICRNIPSDKIFITGVPVNKNFLMPHNKETILKDLNFSPDKKTILFFGGGEFGLGKSVTLNILNCLTKDFSDLQIIAVSGKNPRMNNKFHEIVSQNKKESSVKILEFTDKVPEYMSISDLVITKPGGLTVSESLVSNVPMVIINPIPGQEEQNAEFLEKNQVAIWLKKDDNVSLVLNNLLNDNNKLNKMKNNTKLIAHPDSTKNICEQIIKLYAPA